MDLNWNYGQGVLVLPTSVLSADATPEQLRVLLWLASDASLANKPAQLAKLADTDRATLDDAIEFWKFCGVLTGGDAPKITPPAPSSPKKKVEEEKKPAPAKPLQRANELPVYSSEQIADMVEQRASLRVLLDACQNIYGKMFNPHEINIIFGMVDFLKLDDEYILTLLAHCKKLERYSIRQVERYAISLIDQNITTTEALEERLQVLEAAYTLECAVRSMFGLKSRALTSKEKKLIEKWISFGYDEEIVRRAYEITVNSTGDASIPYAGSILERWYTEGCRTLADVDRKLAEEQAEKDGKTAFGNSFKTDDFFEAAIRNSFRKNDEQS